MQVMKHAATGFALAFLFLSHAGAQQPTPPLMVVQAANAPAAPAVPKTATAPDKSSPSLQAALKVLQQTKAANDETLKKQEAMLQQL